MIKFIKKELKLHAKRIPNAVVATLAIGFIRCASSAIAGDVEASFETLTNLLPGGEISSGATFASDANGMSSDGMVVVGHAASENSPTLDEEAFRWTSSDGMTPLGFLGRTSGTTASFSNGVSGDGTLVVGNATSSIGTQGFYWTQSDGIVGLGVLNIGEQSVALDASYRGAVVVGESGFAFSTAQAFRWTQSGGLEGLGDLDGGATASRAEAISADGSVIVGRGTSAEGEEAFRWTATDGMVGLGDLPGGEYESIAHGVSDDGTVVVGDGQSEGDPAEESSREAFMWTEDEGMVGLGDLEGGSYNSVANAASAHGAVIVGRGTTEEGFTAFRYTDADGMRSIKDILVNDYGIDLTDWRIAIAEDVSGDGRIIVGSAVNPDGVEVAFIATIPLPEGVSEEALGDVDDGGASSNGGSGSGNSESGDNGANDSGGNGGGSSNPAPMGCGVATLTSMMLISFGLCGTKKYRRFAR